MKTQDQNALDEWVSKINKLTREMDESCATVHPDIWPAQVNNEKWKLIASKGPKA